MSEAANAIRELLDNWNEDPNGAREAFRTLSAHLTAQPGTELDFKARPGISYSLRGTHPNSDRPLFVMVDVIDDDPDARWLSVCFFGDMITDPEELGDFVPGGLLGQDGHCFDLDEPGAEMLAYAKARIDEAHTAASGSHNG